MAQWQIKELSDLTGISVRTLHHYDYIGLLEPSVRSTNRYRWYSESDLAKLQQILALKSFGFSLEQITSMLKNKPDMLGHLQAQEHIVKDQVSQLQNTQKVLKKLIGELKQKGSLDWKSCIELIERYQMNEQIKDSWVNQLNQSQKDEYIKIKKEFPKEISDWEKSIAEINAGTLGAPDGPDGKRMVKHFLTIARKMQESMGRQRTFNASIIRGVRDGSITQLPFTKEGGTWLAKAMLAYWLERWDSLYSDIEKNLAKDPKGSSGQKIASSWRKLLSDVFIGTPPELAIGFMFWQEAGRQNAEIAQASSVSIQDQLKKTYVKLAFNPEALAWIETALITHKSEATTC